MRRSTGGAGLRLYVFCPGTQQPTATTSTQRSPGASLANKSEEVGFDLAKSIDACGHNTWIWARRANDENQGFALLKPATCDYPHDLGNWRDHLTVISRARPKVSIGESSDQDLLAQLACSHPRIELDETHIKIRDRLAEMGCAVWVNDHHLLQTHTVLLKRIHDGGDIVGPFETNSPGTQLTSPNCFCFPLRNGAWKVCRFGLGTAEASTWARGEGLYTTCIYNRRPDLKTAAAVTGGKATKANGNEYSMLRDAVEAIQMVDPSAIVEVPEVLATRRAVVRQMANGNFVIEVPKVAHDPDFPGWNSSDKKGHLTQIITSAKPEADVGSTIPRLRFAVTEDKKEVGWFIETDEGWQARSESRVKMWCQHNGMAKPDAEAAMGGMVAAPWTIVCEPFKPEYPGSRKWNQNAPQLAFAPMPHDGDGHPTWCKLLSHLGASLTKPINDAHPALVREGIITGGLFLQAWYAVILRMPSFRLPYLFLTGLQNVGKSLFFEGFEVLLKDKLGSVDSYLAVTEQYNGQLRNSVLNYIDDQRLAPKVNDLLKKLTTSEVINIREMRLNPYMVQNTTHWVHCANQSDALQVPPGDTRNIVIKVNKFSGPEIPKGVMLDRLRPKPHVSFTHC